MSFFKDTRRFDCDVLIIGGGGTGLAAAITAKDMVADVIVASKTRVGYANNTYISAGMIASPGQGDMKDSPELHLKDMMIGGRFINDPLLSERLAKTAGDLVPFLEECGVTFIQAGGSVNAVRFPGHSLPRNVQSTVRRGSGYILPLIKHAQKKGVRFLDNTFIHRLLIQDKRITATMGFNQEGAVFEIRTKSVILATGGFARIYKNNNNASGITGDGHALACELGVPCRDMEFIQFYPTWGTFYEFTIAMGGARLFNSKNEDILNKHGLTDLSTLTRDQLSIAVFSEIQQGLGVDGGVVLDFKSVSDDFKALSQSFIPKSLGNSNKDQVVKPTAHFCMGGLVVNETGMTAVEGLFAAGEICGGVHGANRLGGNALAEVFAMGRIAGKNASDYARQKEHAWSTESLFKEEKSSLESIYREQGEDIKQLTLSLKKTVWEKAGIIRSRTSLEKALEVIEGIELEFPNVRISRIRDMTRYMELKNMITVSKMVCHSALLREESRGSHYRSDFPQEDNRNWLKSITIRKDNEFLKIEYTPADREVLNKLNIGIQV